MRARGRRGQPTRAGARLAGVLLTLALLSGISALPALAQEQGGEALMVVKGVTSPFATFGLLKHLNGIPGVERVDFSLRSGVADVKMKPGATVTAQQLRDAVHSAAYTPGEIRFKSAPTAAATASSGQ